MECAKLIDSFAWKHWKNIEAKPDVDNIAIEIVDIWHFVMSYILEQNCGHKDIDHLVSDVTAVSGQSGRHKDKHIVDNTTTTLTILHIDSLIRLSEARIMSQIEEKNAIAVSIGLAWWQKVLMYLGVASVIAGS